MIGDPVHGQVIFNRCMVCHTIQAGVNHIGPSLHGVVGRPAGSITRVQLFQCQQEVRHRMDRAENLRLFERSAGHGARHQDVLPGASEGPGSGRRRFISEAEFALIEIAIPLFDERRMPFAAHGGLRHRSARCAGNDRASHSATCVQPAPVRAARSARRRQIPGTAATTAFATDPRRRTRNTSTSPINATMMRSTMWPNSKRLRTNRPIKRRDR